LNVPLPISPGRDDVQPQLALSYDSGAGNGLLGLGWSLSFGAITRKTDKGLPRYIESGPDADVYVLSGAEDLVPVLEPGRWTHAVDSRTLSDGTTWSVERFRPRIDRLFSRIGALALHLERRRCIALRSERREQSRRPRRAHARL
jgi:hypothetical protein